MAQQRGMKRQDVQGQVEWHGPNPSGHGAQHDGFILNEDGTAYDRSQNQRYTSAETARLFGIEPSEYAPCVEFAERDGRSSHSTSIRRTIAQHKTSHPKPTKPPQCVLKRDWSDADAIHDYTDEDGTLLFQVARKGGGPGKALSQRRPDGRGGWIYSLDNKKSSFETRRVLYRLPEVRAAPGVIPVEGEKAADAVNAALQREGILGWVATTNPHGAGQWTGERGKSYSLELAGKRIIVLPDADGKGRKHAAAVADSVAPHAVSLKYLELPELPEKGDVVDFLEAGGTMAEVLELADAAPQWEVGTPEPENASTGHIPKPLTTSASGKPEYAPRQLVEIVHPEWPVSALTTQAAHAQRVRAKRGRVLAYNARLGWLFYNGRQWQRDDKAASGATGIVAPLSGMVREEAAELLRHAATLATAGREADSGALARAANSLLRHAAQVESAGFIEGALHLSASALSVPVEQFDQEAWLLGFQNGTWARGQWREHRCDDFLLHLSPVHIDAALDRREWEQVLERLTGGDADFARTLQDVAAYVLSGASHLRVILWLYGPRGTGKSTFAELLQAMLGEMAVSIDPKYLQGDSARERLGASIWNKRLAICAEAGSQKIEAELLKTLSGGDSLPVRFLHREGFTARPRHALMMVANDPPRTDAHDAALRERVIALPFNHPLGQDLKGHPFPLQLTGGTRVEAVRSDPTSPLARGFAAWALEGLARFYKAQEIYRAPVVEAACAQFWADADPVTPFWETVEESEVREGIPKSVLRKRYEEWCDAEGGRPVGRDRWKSACEAQGLEEKKSGGWYWKLFRATWATWTYFPSFPRESQNKVTRKEAGNHVQPAQPAQNCEIDPEVFR